MWYGHVPSVKHLRVFGSTCYALIPKVHRNKLGARSRKCIFLGYSNTSKAYCLYDEFNEKFIVSRDVIFLESSKTDNVVERQLDRLDRFANEKSFQEFDNQIPHLEGGIPILDQHVESSSEEFSPPHETPTTDDSLSDVIDRIRRLNFDSVPTQSTEQPGPFEQCPQKWLTKTLENVHPDEILNQLPSKKLLLMMNGKKRCKRRNNESYITSIKKELGKSFEMIDLGYVHYYLGIEINRHPKSIFLSQKKYIGDLLNRFGMTKCNPLTAPMEQNLKLTPIDGKEFEDATKYRQLVGSLNYLTSTRPDILFNVGILSRFVQKPCEGHWFAAKRVLRYLKGTQDFGIKNTWVHDFSLIGYSESDFDGDKGTRESTSRYAMSLGSRAVSWRSCKQSVPADSTTEAKYMAAAEATKEIVWLRKILEDLQVKQVQ
eukprot:PITA_07878